MLRLIGMLSPAALLVIGGTISGLPLATGGYFGVSGITG